MQKLSKRTSATDSELASLGVRLDPSDLVDFLCTKNKDGDARPIPCHENVLRAVRSFRRVRYNSFNCRYEICTGDTWETREDHHDIQIHSQVSTKFPFLAKQPIGAIRDAITLVGSENNYDSMQDFMRSLTWDQTPRLDTWLHKTYHVEDNEYYTQIGANWIKGLVSRVMFPGNKFLFRTINHSKKLKRSIIFLTQSESMPEMKIFPSF